MSRQDVYIYILLFTNIVFLGLIIYYRYRMINVSRHFKESFGRLYGRSNDFNLKTRHILGTSGGISSESSRQGRKAGNDAGDFKNTISARLNKLSRDSMAFETLLSHIPRGVMIIDRNKRILMVNKNLVELFYLDRDKVIGERTIFVFNNNRLEKLISRACKELKSLRENIVFYREEDLHMDVEVIPIDLNKLVQKNMPATGAAYGEGNYGTRDTNFLILVNNITGEMEFSKLRSQFVANVSHEMRTPLASIRGYLETLVDTGILNDKVKAESYLKKSLDEVERLNILIKDVLDLSKIEYRRNVLFKDRIDLVEIIKSSIDFLDFLARNNNISVSFNCNREPVYLSTDEELFQQLVRNLIENTIFHAGRGARLDINLKEEGDRVELEFKDDGVGINREDQPFIFQRFYRGKNTLMSKRIGSGLGLAIVKHTVDLHGGKIKAESTPGKGTSIRLTFPKKQDTD